MRWNASYVNYAECDDVEGGKCALSCVIILLRTGQLNTYKRGIGPGQCIFGDGLGVGVGRINPFYWPGKGNACGFPDGTSITGQCWTNLTGGVWLSFQKPGECKTGAPIGHNGAALPAFVRFRIVILRLLLCAKCYMVNITVRMQVVRGGL